MVGEYRASRMIRNLVFIFLLPRALFLFFFRGGGSCSFGFFLVVYTVWGLGAENLKQSGPGEAGVIVIPTEIFVPGATGHARTQALQQTAYREWVGDRDKFCDTAGLFFGTPLSAANILIRYSYCGTICKNNVLSFCMCIFDGVVANVMRRL